MNPYRHLTVDGDARTWHTAILETAVEDAVAAGVPEAEIGSMLSAKGSGLQLDVKVAVHPAGHREERKVSLTHNARHRYHDDGERTDALSAATRTAIARWAFNERRRKAIGDADCGLPANHWTVHVPLIARRYAQWRGLGHNEFLHCIDEDETFAARRTGDRLESFSCTLGDARVDASWKATRLELPIHVPHTMDAAILDRPVSLIAAHPVLEDPALVIAGLNRRAASTVVEIARVWTTLGDAP